MTQATAKNLGPYVFENIVDGVILLTGNGTIAYINDSARAILNISDAHMDKSLPGVWLQQMDPRNDDLCQSILNALYNKQKVTSQKVNFYNSENEKQVLHIKSSYWKSPNQETGDGILLIIQDLTSEERLKKEKEDAILVLSVLMTSIGIWSLFYTGLVNFGIVLPMAVLTYIILVLGMILMWFVYRKTDLKFSDIGLSFRNIRKPVMMNTAISLAVCLVMIIIKLILVHSGSGFFPEDQPFFDFTFTWGMKMYPLSVVMQEILSQSIIHECLMRVLKGSHSHILAMALSAVLFTALHFHRGFWFMVGSLLLICIICTVYRKQRTVWGLCITHYTISMMAFFLNFV